MGVLSNPSAPSRLPAKEPSARPAKTSLDEKILDFIAQELCAEVSPATLRDSR